MTRPIKFRAWDKENKKWLDDADFLVSSIGTVLLYDLHFGKKLGNLVGKWYEDEEGRIELVEWTGLHDKNGREIYEGDVVRCFSDSAIVAEVVDEPNLGRGVRDAAGTWQGRLENKNDIEVIGDIYSNPELIK